MLGLKILVCISILCITSYIGIEMSRLLKVREVVLTDAITFLKMVQNEMVYMLNNLPVSYEIARQKINTPLKEAIGSIVVDIEKNGISKVEESIDRNIGEITGLKDEDKTILSSILKSLGKGDIDSQNNIIENGVAILKKQIKEAKVTKESNTKVYKTVGVISGLLIIIVFI